MTPDEARFRRRLGLFDATGDFLIVGGLVVVVLGIVDGAIHLGR